MICALLLMSATINYVDRQVIGILKPTLVQEFGWADERIYYPCRYRNHSINGRPTGQSPTPLLAEAIDGLRE